MSKLTEKLTVTDGRTDGPTLIIEKLRLKRIGLRETERE